MNYNICAVDLWVILPSLLNRCIISFNDFFSKMEFPFYDSYKKFSDNLIALLIQIDFHTK